MEFNSVLFIFIFFPILFLSYLVIPKKLKNFWLLLCSIIFYSWASLKATVIVLCIVLLNYVLGLLIDKSHKKIIVSIGVIFNVLVLGYFKYVNFFITNINLIFSKNINLVQILVPIGISFIIFKSISYLLDVYWRKVDSEKNIIDYFLFTFFFSQVLSGPIVRYVDMKEDLKHRVETLDDKRYGLMRFVIGLSKKVFIANNLGMLVDTIWSLPTYNLSPSIAVLGMIGYTLQIYYDFSGYSDMAIGLARMFGFHFKENFDYPYISKSITEFWRRWHISLSSWFKDYIYIPLGGSRSGNVYCNIFIVFLITGLWHGSSWNFIAWGLWNGIFNMIEKAIQKKGYTVGTGTLLQKSLSWIYTMIVVNIGWILFRAPGLKAAIHYILSMFGLGSLNVTGYSLMYYLDKFNVLIIVIAILFSAPFISKFYKKTIHSNSNICLLIENIGLLCLFALCIIGIVSSSYSSFIYFNF